MSPPNRARMTEAGADVAAVFLTRLILLIRDIKLLGFEGDYSQTNGVCLYAMHLQVMMMFHATLPRTTVPALPASVWSSACNPQTHFEVKVLTTTCLHARSHPY